jgi:starch synthase
VRVLFVSAELFPLAKAGGLADVSAGLPAALAQLGVDVRLLVPGYRSALEALRSDVAGARALGALPIPLAEFAGLGSASVIDARVPGSGVPLWLLDCPERYDHPGGPYQDEDGQVWPDLFERFVLLSRSAAMLAGDASPFDWKPDIVHCNDWHTGLACALLLERATRPRTVFTVHNIAFSGTFPRSNAGLLGLPSALLARDGIGTASGVSLLKAGIVYADWVTTVSPTYAREIRTPQYGGAFAALLERRVESFSGILNGIDDRVWDPATDPCLAAHYDAGDLSGKAACRAALLDRFGITGDTRAPIFGCVSRLTAQKGIDMIPGALSRALESGCRLALLGRGEERMERAILALGDRFPGRVGARFEFSEPLAHSVEAGADIFLMPSRFEPCGLNQMYSLRYGTPPIVHATGGLADTVVDTTATTIARGTATGFTFDAPDEESFADAVARSLTVFPHAEQWHALQRDGMRQDFSWSRSARQYLDLYRSL